MLERELLRKAGLKEKKGSKGGKFGDQLGWAGVGVEQETSFG